MIDSKTSRPVIVQEAQVGLLVKLRDWGDADLLEDRLTEKFEIKPIWSKREIEDGTELFILQFPNEKDRARLQGIVDGIK
jgi:hypothetical protein